MGDPNTPKLCRPRTGGRLVLVERRRLQPSRLLQLVITCPNGLYSGQIYAGMHGPAPLSSGEWTRRKFYQRVFCRCFNSGTEPARNWASGRVLCIFGPDSPSYYLLMPSSKLETLVTADLEVGEGRFLFMKAASPFWDSPVATPPCIRIEWSPIVGIPGISQSHSTDYRRNQGRTHLSALSSQAFFAGRVRLPN